MIPQVWFHPATNSRTQVWILPFQDQVVGGLSTQLLILLVAAINWLAWRGGRETRAYRGVATFILRETRPGSVPSLEAIGRGRIVIQLPMGVPLELDVQVADVRGPAVLSLLGLDVARLNVNIGRGDLLLTLPNTGLERRGEVVLTGGSVEVVVPDDLGIQLSTGGKTPTFAEGAYLLDPSANAYLSRRYDDFAETTELGLTVSGAIRLE